MNFVPEQNFIQHVSKQKYEFSMLDWFGGVFSQIFTVDEEGPRPCITAAANKIHQI